MKVRCIIIAGGLNSQNVEIITGDLGNRQLQPLWKKFYRTPMALHDGEILLFGNEHHENELQCFKLSKKFSDHTVNKVKKYRRTSTTLTTLSPLVDQAVELRRGRSRAGLEPP